MALYKTQVERYIELGAVVRFYWKTCRSVVVYEGNEFGIDGRTYHGFLDTTARAMKRSEVGSSDAGDLVITWTQETKL